MEDHHLLPLVKDLLLEIGLNKKDISNLEDGKCSSNKNQKTENSKFYVDSYQNSPQRRLHSSNVKALNLSPRFTVFTSKNGQDKFFPPLPKKLNGQSAKKNKNDKLYSAVNNLEAAHPGKIRRYKKISKIFGCGIDDMPCTNTYLQDGMVVFIPEIIYELSSKLLKDVSVEGLFRKAGSAQRQNNAKDIINSGQRLPDFIQAVDAACLFKFFLRSLPSPLLSTSLLQIMSKCLSLPEDKVENGLLLSFLAVPKNQRHVLSYIFEVLHIVSSSENSNRMNANNLAIVLAPNFLSTMFRTQKKGWALSANEKDNILPSTIAIIEKLIKMANKLGRVPQILEEKLKSIYSAESIENIARGSSKKKRRSGSLQRLFAGFRKVVQGPTSGDEPLFNSFKPKSKRQSTERSDHSDKDVEVLTAPSSVAKRKSFVLEDCLNCKENDVSMSTPCIKRPRLYMDGSSPPILPPRRSAIRHQEEHVKLDALIHTVQPKIMRPSRRDISVHRRYSLRDRVQTSGNPKKAPAMADKQLPSMVDKQLPAMADKLLPAMADKQLPAMADKLLPAMADKQLPARRQSLRLAGISPSFNINIENSHDFETNYSHREQKKSPNNTERPRRRVSSSGKHELPVVLNELSNINQSKTDFTVSPMLQEKSDISPENRVKSCINSGTPCRNSTISRRDSGSSHVEMVQSTYEAVKLESKNFEVCPCESFSRRLSKELKRRGRRSAEYKVQRSPSERRISKIRRRSKENTPLQSPARGVEGSPYSLRRGKPNTLASGLPLLSKPLNASDFKDCDKHLKFRARSVSLIANTSSEPYISRDLSFSGDQTSTLEPCSHMVSKHLNSFRESAQENTASDNKLSISSESSLEKSNLIHPIFVAPVFGGSDNNIDWVPARKANIDSREFLTPNKAILDLTQHRMSIDALKKQKKVTANLKLFNGPGTLSMETSQVNHVPYHTPAIKSTLGGVQGHSAFSRRRSRMVPILNSNCFQGQSGFTPLPPKPFRPKRLMND